MNKKITYLSVFLVLALFLISSCQTIGRQISSQKQVADGSYGEGQSCTDSDGGLNYYIKGNTYGTSADGSSWNKTDYCEGNIINEYNCNGNLPGDGGSYNCPNGCKDGACIEKIPTTEKVTYQGVLDMLTSAKHLNPYEKFSSGVGKFLADGMTANEYCKNKGYGNCLLVINNFGEVYFNSNDLSCNNGINYDDKSDQLNLPADCNTRFDYNFYLSHDPRTKNAVCLGGGSGGSDHWDSYYVRFICAKAQI